MTTLVVDTSAAVDLVVIGPRTERVRARLAEADDLVSPDLIGVEVLSALARLERGGRLSSEMADAAARLWWAGAVRRLPVGALDAAAWRLRHRMRVTDAYFVAASIAMGAALLTCDGRLARSALSQVPVSLVQ